MIRTGWISNSFIPRLTGMLTPPGTAQIGMRLTIALRDSQGNARGLLGVLHDEQTIRRRDGSLATFDPDTITC